jgi:hypothetical protein
MAWWLYRMSSGRVSISWLKLKVFKCSKTRDAQWSKGLMGAQSRDLLGFLAVVKNAKQQKEYFSKHH